MIQNNSDRRSENYETNCNPIEDFYWILGNYIHRWLNIPEYENSYIFKHILGQHYGEFLLNGRMET